MWWTQTGALSVGRGVRGHAWCRRRRWFSDLSGQTVLSLRNTEVEQLSKLLSAVPKKVLVITGDKGVGKSVLLSQVLAPLDLKQAAVDLDVAGSSSLSSFRTAIQRQLIGWKDVPGFAKGLSEYPPALYDNFEFPSIHPTVAGEGENLPIMQYRNSAATSNQPVSLEKYTLELQVLRELLPGMSARAGSAAQAPILIVEGAEKLQLVMDRDPDGKAAVKAFLQFCVACTKQHHNLHVVLVSDDTLFIEWLHKEVKLGPHIYVCTIGNLSKQDAGNFYRWACEQLASPPPWPLFEDVFEVCGGRMADMQHYLTAFDLDPGVTAAAHFRRRYRPALRAALKAGSKLGGAELDRKQLLKIIVGYLRGTIHSVLHDALSDGPKQPAGAKWDRTQLLTVMRRLVHQAPFIAYEDAKDSFGEDVVVSLIEHDILMLRASRLWAWDLPGAPADDAVVTAPSPAQLFVMREVLKEVDGEDGDVNGKK